jgi:transcriptional regulator with PAS, ATPase and Fis domain
MEDKMRKTADTVKTALRQEIKYLMGKGKVISKVLDQVEKYASIDEPIFIEGETGTGKELIARYLSDLSGRKITVVNCGAVFGELINSDLFGSKKGAFTGAVDMKGKVEAAEGGILFLDEFNSLPLEAQGNILRLIEHKTFTIMGDTVERKADVRIIAAGNKSFKELVEKGELRQDLYGRFIKTIYVPTLKERIEDIDYFIDRFINEYSKKLGKDAGISDAARNLLAGYDWPENVRQLRYMIKVLIIETEMDSKSKKYVIQPELVQQCLNERDYNTTAADVQDDDDYTLQTAQKKAVMRALDKTNGNDTKACELLGVSKKTVYNMKKKFGI